MNIFVLTGAGISAESGLDTFRGNGGLWDGHSLEEICTPEALTKFPDLVRSFYDERRIEANKAKPNGAHFALSKLERHWRENVNGEFLLVTQNVDDLHSRAGSENVIHMHGRLHSASCMECGWHGPRYNSLENDSECPQCQRDALRPDIVLFGEAPRLIRQIEAFLDRCNLFLAVGTSGLVLPAADFVKRAKKRGAVTHQFNVEFPMASHLFDICHLGMAGDLLPAWVDELIGDRPRGWDLTIEQKAAFIREMEECGAHVTFFCNDMVRYMTAIGLDAEELADGSMRLFDRVIRSTQPEWGVPGIYAPNVLSAAIEAHSLNLKTAMLGRGFGHQDLLRQLKHEWLG